MKRINLIALTALMAASSAFGLSEQDKKRRDLAKKYSSATTQNKPATTQNKPATTQNKPATTQTKFSEQDKKRRDLAKKHSPATTQNKPATTSPFTAKNAAIVGALACAAYETAAYFGYAPSVIGKVYNMIPENRVTGTISYGFNKLSTLMVGYDIYKKVTAKTENQQ